MLFSQDKNKKQNSEKKRSIFGLLFNPRLDRDIAPIKENAGMFVQMLASLFVTVGLFPKDHPGFTDSKTSLSMRQVIGTAYSNLKFTKEGLPQVLYFAAVVGMLGFSALFLITLLLSFMTGSAHAQSIFESPAGTNDWGIAIIDYLFMGKDAPTLNAAAAFPDGDDTIQKALGSALAFYSSAVLVLAGLLLLYHLTFMIAETAHSGQAMGQNANKVWAPIRLIIAIGLLVPIASAGSGVTGYNTGQYLGMQVAKWGSGLASNVWTHFAKSLENNEFGCTQKGSDSPSCLRLKSDAPGLVADLLLIEGCSALVEHHLKTGGFDEYYTMQNLTTVPTPDTEGSHYLALKESKNSPEMALKIAAPNMAKLCGGYEVPPINPNYTNLHDAQLAAFTKLKTDVHTFVQNNIKYSMIHGGEFKDVPDQEKLILKIIQDYQKELNNSMTSALSADDASLKSKNQNPLNSSIYTTTGWLTAGAWFNHIIKANAERADAFYASAPLTLPPNIYADDFSNLVMSKSIFWGGAKAHNKQVKGFLESARDDLTVFSQTIDNDISTIFNTPSSLKALNDDRILPMTADEFLDAIKTKNAFEFLMYTFDQTGGLLGLWDSNTNALAIKFGLNRNPLAEIASFGQKNLQYASDLYVFGGFALLAGSSIAGVNISVLADGIASMIFTVASIFLLIGFAMAYIIPLYPFFRFFFASITWFMSIFELIVSIPLFALAHINPNGAGISGDKARYGYAVMLQVLLRPVLMVLGLIAGFLIFTVAIHFLNFIIITATSGTGAFGGNLHTISKFIYSILYCLVVVMFANQCFSTIGLFPQTALQWLGMGNITEEKLNDAAEKVAAVATYGTRTMGGQIQQLASTPGKLNASRKSKIDSKTAAAGAATKEDRDSAADARDRWAKYDEGIASGRLPADTTPPDVDNPGS